MKKVLLIIIDALGSRATLPAISEGRLPHFQALIDVGSLNPSSTAVFPSITPAATSSIITGRYPQDHGIAGDYWYNVENGDVAYFGSDFQVVWKHGMGVFFDDFLVKLNHQRLKSKTLFQQVEQSGLKAACLNYMIYRGNVLHRVDVPRLLTLIPDVPLVEHVYGPSLLRLGDFVEPDVVDVDLALNTRGPFSCYGFEDKYTAKDLLRLARERQLPECTVAYFPDNDFVSHAEGSQQAVPTLEQVDAYLGELIEVCGGLDAMLRESCVIITGDHAQSDILVDSKEAGINLEKLLSEFNVADAGTPMSDDEHLAICPNLRVAQIYFRQPNRGPVEKVVAQLLSEPRIDQVIWSAEITGERKPGYYVATRSRGTVRFWHGDDGLYAVADQYGTKWSWDGSLTAVDGQVENKSLLTFPTYPNAFERIAGGLNVPEGGHLWVTALPGYEFRLSGMKIHSGGSHGSLHELDSTVPLIAAGLPSDLQLPQHLRSVDVAPLCASVLGVQVGSSIGMSHMSYS